MNGEMEVKGLRGSVVCVAKARMGGILWTVGIFASKVDAKKYLCEYWPLDDDVTQHITSYMTVL